MKESLLLSEGSWAGNAKGGIKEQLDQSETHGESKMRRGKREAAGIFKIVETQMKSGKRCWKINNRMEEGTDKVAGETKI